MLIGDNMPVLTQTDVPVSINPVSILHDHAFSSASMFDFDIVNLDFCPIERFFTSLDQKAEDQLKIVPAMFNAKISFTDNGEIDATKVGHYLAFRQNCNLPMHYQIG